MTYLPPFSEDERARILGSAASPLPRDDGSLDAQAAARIGEGPERLRRGLRQSTAAASEHGPRYADFLGDQIG